MFQKVLLLIMAVHQIHIIISSSPNSNNSNSIPPSFDDDNQEMPFSIAGETEERRAKRDAGISLGLAVISGIIGESMENK
jgi:hypothetical protein